MADDKPDDDKPDQDRRSLLREGLPLAAVAAASVGTAQAQTPEPTYTIPGVRLIFTAWVRIAAMKTIGETLTGQGRLIPITGGTFEGPRLKSKVLAGGADWQTVRPDGVTELHAHYGLETEDGAIIQIWNDVLVRPDLWSQRGSYACTGRNRATFTIDVRNYGLDNVPPGVVVGFYRGIPGAGGMRIGEVLTTGVIAPMGGSERVTFDATLALPVTDYYALLDDPSMPTQRGVLECRENNNAVLIWRPFCP